MIPTAEEIFEKLNPQDGTLPKWAKEFAIELTRLHCKEQAIVISENVVINELTELQDYYIDEYFNGINKDSILNAYDLNNIK